MTRKVPFRPKLEGEFRTRFYDKVSCLSSDTTSDIIDRLAEEEEDWATNICKINIVQRKRYRATWLLLRDLCRASWKPIFENGVLEMELSETDTISEKKEDIKNVKNLLRSWMSSSRLEKISIYSDFVKRMESKNSKGYSIMDLIADGEELSARMKKLKTGERNLEESIKPYLQLVKENEIDPISGFKLSEIWRYFRLTWSSPYESTPGRTMLYLLRDAAHYNHPVMGIASLENCALKIFDRDVYIGWDYKCFYDKMSQIKSEDQARTLYASLLSLLDYGFETIDYSNLCKKSDLENPTEELIEKLEKIAYQSESERQERLKQLDNEEENRDLGKTAATVSRDALFKRKRAEQMADFLRAKRTILNFLSPKVFSAFWESWDKVQGLPGSVKIALMIQKNKHIGSSMLELNVCGAIPPYNELLVGKLVAFLALSPQVILDYKNRYKNQPSEIASELKGQDVIKPADLAYIGTTSLYKVGSSQYNRLKIPSSVLGTDFTIEWKQIGETKGYGTLHISKQTTACLYEALNEKSHSINHIFGEGASPKMRLLRLAITELLENPNKDTIDFFTRHAMPRIVYGAFTASNSSDYLCGKTDKILYYFNPENALNKTNDIIRFWEERWLMSRLNFEPIFSRIYNFDKNSFLLKNDIDENNAYRFIPIRDDMNLDQESNGNKQLDFLRNFYRGNSAYADFQGYDDLKKIHIKTSLDDAIIDCIEAGNDVVLTGNPGDGKTHIIRMLNERFLKLKKKPIIELDASTKSDEDLYDIWKNARNNGIPFVLAINAALLYTLGKKHTENYIQSAREQMISALELSEENLVEHNNNKDNYGVVVFDLSKRDILSTQLILSAVFDNMTQDRYFVRCKTCPLGSSCPVQKNKVYLKNGLFQQRLWQILNRASLKGYHTTLREIQSLASFLLFGNRSCAQFAHTASSNDFNIVNLIYKGKGNIFKAIKTTFDPSSVSHPIWDEILLKDQTLNDWTEPNLGVIESISPSNDEIFKLRKRLFFFFHKEGDSLLKITKDDVTDFQSFLKQGKNSQLKDIIYKINKLFGCEDKQLRIWNSHRFNNNPRKMLLSTGGKSKKEFTILVPSLIKTMTIGIDYQKKYVLFALKNDIHINLRIDFNIYHMLKCVEKGIPQLLIESEEVKQIWRFMDQLRTDNEDEFEEEYEILISDLESSKEISVHIEDNKYQSLQELK